MEKKKDLERELEDLYRMKSWLADALASMLYADGICLTEKEIGNIKLCLTTLNDYLNADIEQKENEYSNASD